MEEAILVGNIVLRLNFILAKLWPRARRYSHVSAKRKHTHDDERWFGTFARSVHVNGAEKAKITWNVCESMPVENVAMTIAHIAIKKPYFTRKKKDSEQVNMHVKWEIQMTRKRTDRFLDWQAIEGLTDF